MELRGFPDRSSEVKLVKNAQISECRVVMRFPLRSREVVAVLRHAKALVSLIRLSIISNLVSALN